MILDHLHISLALACLRIAGRWVSDAEVCAAAGVSAGDSLVSRPEVRPSGAQSDDTVACSRAVFVGLAHIILFMFLEVPLLHFETIGISPESLVGLETTVHFPGNDDLFALLVVRDGNRIELNFEFYDFSEGLRESHLHDCLLVATCNGRSSV